VKSFQAVAEHEERRIAPGGDTIQAFLPEAPCLIRMDEVLNYISRYRDSQAGEATQFYNFLQNLSEEARSRTNVVLAASIPKSETEMTREDEADYQRLKHMLDRVGKAVLMSAETETSEIIRRRLFEWSGLPEEAKKTAAAFSEWAREHKSQLGAFDVDTARERFLACYPSTRLSSRSSSGSGRACPASRRRAGFSGCWRCGSRMPTARGRPTSHPIP
jgi:hypothetical protein